MAETKWKGVFVDSKEALQPESHLLDVTGFASTDAILVRTIPEGITIPVEIGKLLSNDRTLFATFLKEALEKCATSIALLYTGSGTSPKLVTESKKFAERAAKFSGSEEFSQTTRTFVEALQTAAQATIREKIPTIVVVGAFTEFKTLGTFRKNVSDKLGDNVKYFTPMVDVLDSLALPANTPRRVLLGLDRGNIANVYRNVFIAMIYLIDGDLNNSQLINNLAYATAIWWAQLFKNLDQKPVPQQPKKK
jgi:hypothetical protein